MKKVTILFKDHFKTSFMQGMDVFSRDKVIYIRTEATVVDDYGPSHAAKAVEVAKNEPYRVIAIFDADTLYYRDPNVKLVSDGETPILLDDLLPITSVTP